MLTLFIPICIESFQSSTSLQMKFFELVQSNLDLPLNTKSMHNHVIELLRKFGNFRGPGFYVMNFVHTYQILPFCSFDVD
jgi:hypothetical protein